MSKQRQITSRADRTKAGLIPSRQPRKATRRTGTRAAVVALAVREG